MSMNDQINLFEFFPDELQPGDIITRKGAPIDHISRRSYIGKMVCFDCSTESRKMYRVGILEKYIPHDGTHRSIVYTGERQRSLITHYPGREIYEIEPWDFEKRRGNRERM